MKNNSILTKNDVESLYKSLEEGTTRGAVKAILKDMNEVCSRMVEANATPSVPAVVKALASKGVIVSERTIYNKRQGKNPYPVLIEAWIKVAQSKKLNFNQIVKSTTEPQPDIGIQVTETAGLITDDDLLKIQDPVLRHKISVLFGQAASLKKQNSALRELRELPAIHPDNHAPALPQSGGSASQLASPQLDKYETDILTNFLNGQGAKGLYFDDQGALCSSNAIRRDSILSDPGLKDVIEKLLPPKLTES